MSGPAGILPPMEIGLYTFGELAPDPATGARARATRLRELIEEIALADQVGLDVFGVGEHHRPDFAVSAPAVVLARGGGADDADPADQRRQRPQLRRPGAGLPGVRDARPALGRARRDHGRAAARSSSRSRSSATTCATTTMLFAEKLELLLACASASGSPGRAATGRPIDDRGVYPRPRRTRCRSGSPSAARRSRPSAPARWACRWRSRSSAACRSASPRSSTSTASRARGRARPGRCRSASTRTASSPTPPSGPPTTPSRRSPRSMNRIGRERGFAPMDRAVVRRSRAPRGRELASAARRRSPTRSSSSTRSSATTASCCR